MVGELPGLTQLGMPLPLALQGVMHNGPRPHTSLYFTCLTLAIHTLVYLSIV